MASSNITKIPLSMINASGAPDDDIRFDGDDILVTPDGDERRLGSGVSQGVFDDVSGTLTISLIDGTTVNVPGFVTKATLGTGQQGQHGASGTSGANGTDGQHGATGAVGCMGPSGAPGIPGQKGDLGYTGDRGIQGDRGITGDRGVKGVIQTYIQSADPGPVGAGAIWVKA